jgi:NADH dehydrogenase
MAARSVATVFGGSGFIGRYVVQRLAARGHIVRVAVRDPEAALFLKTAGTLGQIVLLAAPITDEAAVARAVEGADLVVNLVGILAEQRAGDFQRIHAEGAGRVARLSAAAGVRRLVHVSAIGADPAAASRYAASKGAGEKAVSAAFPAATILRPSVVFGTEDGFFNRFAFMARMLPFMPVIAGGAKLQPVYVGDVADAVLAALDSADAAGKVFELGGPRVLSMREVAAYILTETGREKRLISMPMALLRLKAFFWERMPGKLLTRDQLKMLEHDNVVAPGAAGLAALGIVPTPIELEVPTYLRRFRPGGGVREIVAQTATGG